MRNSISIHKNADRNELKITQGQEQAVIDLSQVPQHQQIEMVHRLIEWKNNGYQGIAPI